MLAAEAMRLAAIEALCPTASKASDAGWPTLARHRVYDSKGILPEEVEAAAPYTPCLSVFTDDVRVERRGEASHSVTGTVTAALVVIAELAVTSRGEQDEMVAVPLAAEDAQAQLVLGALCAQVRRRLVFAEAGSIFRTIVGAVEDLRLERFSLPQFDIRWMRTTMRLTCRIRDDKFTDAAGMPEPMLSLYNALPEASYARAKLAELTTAFTTEARTQLERVEISADGLPTDRP